MKNKILNILSLQFLRGKILWKVSLWGWLLILATIAVLVFFTIPFQKSTLLTMMESEADEVASSIIHANYSSLITQDYGSVVEHCSNIVMESNSILYVVVTKNDGYSLVFTRKGWEVMNLSGIWRPDSTHLKGHLFYSKLVNKSVFHKSVPFVYSGIDWGWIHIGLSLNNYRKSVNEISMNVTWLTIVMAFIGILFSMIFARHLTNPIRVLDNTTKEIADGNLNVRADISTKDELESLASSFNQMTDSLRNARDQLEAKVKERTVQLEKINEVLTKEISEKKKVEDSLQSYTLRLEGLQDIYRSIIAAKTGEEILLDTLTSLQNQISYFDNAFLFLFNESSFETTVHNFIHTNDKVILKGKTFILTDNHSERRKLPELMWEHNLTSKQSMDNTEKELIRFGANSYIRLLLKFQNGLIGELIFTSPNEDQFTYDDCTTCYQISKQLAVAFVQSKMQEDLVEQAAYLHQSLKEKEVLLKEIHHRVKNNLQIITSLLNLQSSSITDDDILSIFRDSQNRIKSMALVHEKLYQSKDLSRVDLSEYIKNLSFYIQEAYSNKNIELNFELDRISLQIDTIVPLGLILNELISNAFKYAFNGNIDKVKGNRIIISAKNENEEFYSVSVIDNGIGLPHNFNIETNQSLGLKLVYNLCIQIESKLKIESEQGAKFTILLPK